MSQLTGLTVEIHKATETRTARLITLYPEGASFYDDESHAYGFRADGSWVEHEVKPHFAPRLSLRQLFRQARNHVHHELRLPLGLGILAANLYGSHQISDREAVMDGYGGCYFHQDQVTMQLSRHASLESAEDGVIEVVSFWFGTRRDQIAVTLTPISSL